MAQSVISREALKKIGIDLAGMALACFGLANKAEAVGQTNSWCVMCRKGCKAGGGSPDYCRQVCGC